MKLNNDQRIVMQALLDGKTVKFKTEEIYTWCPLFIEDIGIIGEPGVQYLIKQKKKTMKVAVFAHRDMPEWYHPMAVEWISGQPDSENYIRVSDIVEIEYKDKS